MNTQIEKNETSSLEEALVLIGSTRFEYVAGLLEFMKDKKAVWSGWSFRIRQEWRKTILDKLKSQGKFPLLFYMSKKRGGSGKVEFVAVFNDIQMSDTPAASPDLSLTTEYEKDSPTEDFQTYTWFKFYDIKYLPPLDLNLFMDIDTEDPIKPSQLRSAFAYAYLPEDFEERIKEEPVVDIPISDEQFLRKYLVANLDSLEPGLELYSENGKTGEEYVIDVGRIDILGVDRERRFVVIELKAGNADHSTYGQICAYMGWLKRNLAKEVELRGIIIANSFDEKLKNAASLLPNLELRKYELKFEFEDVEY